MYCWGWGGLCAERVSLTKADGESSLCCLVSVALLNLASSSAEGSGERGRMDGTSGEAGLAGGGGTKELGGRRRGGDVVYVAAPMFVFTGTCALSAGV
jgi:hypothetical protein